MTDNVNHPMHYSNGSIECIDAIESALTPEEFEGFLHGNMIKYDWRYRNKNGLEDLKKSSWYNNKLQSTISKHKKTSEINSKASDYVISNEAKRFIRVNTLLTSTYKTNEFPRINDKIKGEDGIYWLVVDVKPENYPYIVSGIRADYLTNMLANEDESEIQTLNNPQSLRKQVKELKACWFVLAKSSPYAHLAIGHRKYFDVCYDE